MDFKAIIGIGLSIMVILAVALVFILKRDKKRAAAAGYLPKKRSSHGLTIEGRVADLSQKFFITQKFYNLVARKVIVLCPADQISMRNLVGKILIKCYGWLIAAIGLDIAVTILINFDLFYTLILAMFAYVMMRETVSSSTRRLTRQLREQSADALETLRHNFHECEGKVDAALEETVDDSGAIVAPHLNELSRILHKPSSEIMEEVADYTARDNDAYMKMLLSICATVKEEGDTVIDNGKSLFVTSIGYLREKINAELLALKTVDYKFQSMVPMALIPLAAIKLLEFWFSRTFPQLSSYFEGMYATFSLFLSFIVVLAVYTMIDNLKNIDNSRIRTESIWLKIANISFIDDILVDVINHRYTHWLRIDSQLRGNGDHTGPRAFIVKKVCFGIAGFILTLVMCIGGEYAGRSGLLSDFTNDYKESVSAPDAYKQNMYSISEDTARKHLDDPDVTQESLKTEIKETYGFNDTYADTMATAVIEHMKRYNNRYFKWWELLLSLVVGAIAYCVPQLMLIRDKDDIERQKKTEILNFNTLMLILINIPNVSIDMVLEWLEMFSSVYKELLSRCIIRLSLGQNKAIQEMKDSDLTPKFRNFCDSLLAIDNVGISEAFTEVEADHANYMADITKEQEKMIEKRARKAGRICMIPFWLILILYLGIPMIRYALAMLEVFTETMGSI